jgi:hypothetical protein
VQVIIYFLRQKRKSLIIESNVQRVLRRIVIALRRVEFVSERIRLLFI